MIGKSLRCFFFNDLIYRLCTLDLLKGQGQNVQHDLSQYINALLYAQAVLVLFTENQNSKFTVKTFKIRQIFAYDRYRKYFYKVCVCVFTISCI